ncbi:hypothetical protein BGZ83_007162 [Gryganskiella cystojenkinii]|nr:hypothetical protein BGZ83_007162 [Gryganskiella cystojenkinii]
MSSALDMSLDDIIKSKNSSDNNNSNTYNSRNNQTGGSRFHNRGGSSNFRGGRAVGPTRHPRGGRDHNNRLYQFGGVQQYRAMPEVSGPLHTALLRQSIPDGSKIQISNLERNVTADDLKMIFSTRVGPLKKTTLMYDEDGKSTGSAIVHFVEVKDAAVALQKFSGVPLDGHPMKIELIVAPAALQNILPSAPAQRPPPIHFTGFNNNYNVRGNPYRGGFLGRGTGRGSHRGGGRGGYARGGDNNRRETKTAEQLDAEMNEYNMQVDDS